MKQFKAITLCLFCLTSVLNYAQVTENSELFKTLKSMDSLLFDISFNKCKTEVLENVLAEDLEFYHDQVE